MLRTLILAATAIAVTTPAHAQTPAAPKPLSRAELTAKLDSAFAAMDANHDGSISVAEVQAAENRDLQQLQNQRRAEIDATFKKLDTNHDGQLSIAEFSAAVNEARLPQTPQQVLQSYDTNHDGKISAAEFKAPRIQSFDRVDANHDGTVTPAELQAYAKAHPGG